MLFKLDEGAFPPEKAHKQDAGFDVRARESKVVRAHNGAVFHTGVHVQLPQGTAGLLVSKSGLNVRHDITSTGLIDEGYTGEIVVKLDNSSDKDYFVNAGDKISQLVVFPVWYDPIIEIVDEINGGDRGNNGFGSSGK